MEGDYTLWITIVFLALTAALWLVRRRAHRAGAVEVTDSVCGVSFERREAEATEPTPDGETYFCSAQCAGTFRQTSGQVAAVTPAGGGTAP